MKTGEPITPIINEKGYKVAEMTHDPNSVYVEFSPIAGKFNVGALEGIIDLMEKKELDLCLQKSA